MKPKIYLPLIDNGMGLSRTSWAYSLVSACVNLSDKYQFQFSSISFPSTQYQVNKATQEFMTTDCSEMVIIDTDVVFKTSHLAKLLSHNEEMVFGLYPKKVVGLVFPVQPLESDPQPFAEDGRGDLREVAACARGFVRINRSVFEKLVPHVEAVVDDHNQSDMRVFWPVMPGGHSEDFAFCHQWRKIGGKVLVDRKICAQHDGSALYPIPGTFA